MLLCAARDHCLTRTFRVVAIDSAGRRVRQSTTSGVDNDYRLSLPAGRYTLLATSDGLRCSGTTLAAAGRAVTAELTCLVP